MTEWHDGRKRKESALDTGQVFEQPIGWALAHLIFLQGGHGGASFTLLVLIKTGSLSDLPLLYPARLQKQIVTPEFIMGGDEG